MFFGQSINIVILVFIGVYARKINVTLNRLKYAWKQKKIGFALYILNKLFSGIPLWDFFPSFDQSSNNIPKFVRIPIKHPEHLTNQLQLVMITDHKGH